MSTIKIKRSGTGGQAPAAGDLAYGELALNYADGKLYYKDATDAVAEIGAGGSGGGLDSAGVQSFLSGLQTVSIGVNSSAATGSVAIGDTASVTGNGVAIGNGAVAYQKGVAIGQGAHHGLNGHNAVVIGYGAGSVNTGFDAVAIGYQAGGGANSGGSYPNIRHRNVYIGGSAGAERPNAYSIAIGWEAGKTNHGESSIAIGRQAGRTNQGHNNIIINGTGVILDRTDNFGIDIRTSAAGSLTYSTDSDWTFGAPVTSSEFKFTDGTSMTTAPTGGGAGGLDSAAVLSTVGIDSSSISLGALADPSTFTNTIAIGHKSTASGAGSTGRTIAIGYNARTSSNNSTAIGADAYAKDQSCTAIGPGTEADGQQSTAIGNSCSSEAYSFAAGRNSNATGAKSVAIGNTANATAQEVVVIGSNAGTGASNSGVYSICIGTSAGRKGFGQSAILIGQSAGYASLASPVGQNSIGIGVEAGVGSGENTISIGEKAGYYNTQGNYAKNAIFINASGQTGQVDGYYKHFSVDIRSNDSDGRMWFSKDSDWNFGAAVTAPEFKFSDGTSMTTAPTGGSGGGLDSAGVQSLIDADLVGSGLDAVQIGLNSIASGARSISIGANAAATDQNNIAIGNSAGDAGSSQSTIAIGQLAKGGNQTGDTGSVAIGQGAGQYTQGPYTVAIGMNAGRGGGSTATRQQSGAVAAGYQSGYSEQGANGIAIGREAGWSAQGDNSIAIGYLTGKSGQGANNIAINATGAAVNRLDQYGIDIRTSDSGSVTYSTDSDWVFGASVNVNGGVNASGDITAFSTAVSSDPRLKTDIVKIDNAVEKVQQLNGVSWDWTRGGKSAGVLSTDVAAVLPEAVTTGKIFGEDTEYDKVNYNALIGLLVEAVKDLQSQVDDLKAGE